MSVGGDETTRITTSPDGQTIAMTGAGLERSGGNGTYLFSFHSEKRISERLSRQSSKLGFSSERFSAEGKEVMIGRTAVNIATGAERQTQMPDNVVERSLTIAKEEGEERLIHTSAQDGNKRVLARVRAPATIRLRSGSPDRTKITYRVFPDGTTSSNPQLQIAAIDGSWDRIVDMGAKYARGGGDVSWSPDSSRIALTLREDLPGEIGVLENFMPPEKVAAK